MNVDFVRDVFLWCTVINYGMLIFWALMFIIAREWMYQLHGRWFRLSTDQFDAIHYAGMAIYKIGIFLFCLVPYVALLIVS